MAGDDAGGVLGTRSSARVRRAAGATAVAAPLLAAAAHPAANYGVRFPLLTRAAFGVEGAKALVSARRLVCSGLCALHFLAGADALHVLSATLAPGSSVLGNGAWSSALCYLLAWLAQSPAGATFCRAALVKAGGAFAVVAALSAAKAAAFAPAAAAKAAAAAAAASGAPSSGHVSADIGLAIVGVWFAMSSSFLDTAASATVRAATQATKLGEALPPAGDRAAAHARRLPFAAALAAAALSSALNPSGAFGAELGGAMSSWLLPLLVAVAAPAATATLRGGGADLNGRGSTTVSEANVALFAAAATLFSAGVPARGAAAAAAFAGGGAFAAAASVVAPAMAVALADYFVVRRRALDTAALVDGKDAKGDFWFRGVQPARSARLRGGRRVPAGGLRRHRRDRRAHGERRRAGRADDPRAGNRAGARRGPRRRGRRRRVPRAQQAGAAAARRRGRRRRRAGGARGARHRRRRRGDRRRRGRRRHRRAEVFRGGRRDRGPRERGKSLPGERTRRRAAVPAIKKRRERRRPRRRRRRRRRGDDRVSRVDRARSRLERLLEMESATPPDVNAFSPRLEDTALGASLRAELERHLERRRERLGALRAERSARGARASPTTSSRASRRTSTRWSLRSARSRPAGRGTPGTPPGVSSRARRRRLSGRGAPAAAPRRRGGRRRAPPAGTSSPSASGARFRAPPRR